MRKMGLVLPPLIKAYSEDHMIIDEKNNNEIKQPSINWLNYTDTIKLLVENGADCTIRNWGRATPLHILCYEGDLDMVELIIGKYKSLDIFSAKRNTPLTLCWQKHINIIKLLQGVDVNIRNTPGRTPIHSSLLNNHTEAMSY